MDINVILDKISSAYDGDASTLLNGKWSDVKKVLKLKNILLSIEEYDCLLDFKDQQKDRLLETIEKQNEAIEMNLVSHVVAKFVRKNESFKCIKEFMHPLCNNYSNVDLIEKYRSRKLARTSNAISADQSSVKGNNNFNSFRFDQLHTKKFIVKIETEKKDIADIVIFHMFGNNQVNHEKYLKVAVENLKCFRMIFECQFSTNDKDLTVDEVTMFQPLFRCLLLELLSDLASNFEVENANSIILHFKEALVSNPTVKTEVTGCTDLMVSSGPFDKENLKPVNCIFELKSPPTFSRTSDFDGPKNQVLAQTLGFKTVLAEQEDQRDIFKACLTDGFAIYICFLFRDVYYISSFTAEPEDYINALLFQLCDITSEKLDELIKKSKTTEANDIDNDNVEEDAKNINSIEKEGDSIAKKNNDSGDKNTRKVNTTTNNDSNSSKRPMQVINFNYEDQLEQYQNKLAYIARLGNAKRGYALIDEETLQNYAPNNNGLNPSDYVMSKFLNDA